MRRTLLLLALTASPAFADGPPTTAPDAEPATAPASRPADDMSPVATRLQNRQQLRDDFDALPKLPASPIAGVVSIKLDGGHVHVTTPLPPAATSSIDVPDWPGRTLVNVGPAGSLQFHLKHERLLDDDLTLQNTEVYTGPDYLQIVRDTESPTGLHSVTLIQSRQSADNEGNPVRLLINESHEDGFDSKKTLTGESFEKLRQTSDLEMRKEFLPILRDLGAASMLQSVSPESAWQVLGGEVKPDAALAQQIDTLLPQLSADEFATRSKAEETLGTLGPAGAAAVAQRDLSTLSPDARAAVDNFLHRTRKLDTATATKFASDPDFLLNTISAEIDPRLSDAALTHLKTATGKTLDLPSTLSADEKQKRIEAFRAQLNPTTQPSS